MSNVMHLFGPPNEDVADDAEDAGAESVARISFFAPNEDDDLGEIVHYDAFGEDDYAFVRSRDRAVATNIYRLYLRGSVEHGFESARAAAAELARARFADTRACLRAARRANPALEHELAGEDEDLDGDQDDDGEDDDAELPQPEEDMARGELKERVAQEAARLAKELGRPPTVDEVFEAVRGAVPSTTRSSVRMTLTKHGIRFTPRRGGRDSARKSATPPVKKRRARLVDSRTGKAPAEDGQPITASLAIMALQTERAKVAAELAAIDSVIERLRR